MTWSSSIFLEPSTPPVIMIEANTIKYLFTQFLAYVSAARLPPASDANNTYIGWAGRTSGWGAAEDGNIIK